MVMGRIKHRGKFKRSVFYEKKVLYQDCFCLTYNDVSNFMQISGEGKS